MDIYPFVSDCVDSILSGAKKLVQDGEEVAPQIMFFALENGEFAILPLIGIEQFFQSKEAKRALRSLVKTTWSRILADKPHLRLIAVLTLSDAYVESVSNAEFQKMMKNGRDVPFSPKPGMAESLIIMVSMADGELQYHWPYIRGREEVVFTPEPIVEKSPEGPKGMGMGLWPL